MKGRSFALILFAAAIPACAREEDVEEEGAQRVELLEPSEAPFDLDQISNEASNAERAANAGSASECAKDKCIANTGE